MFDWEQVRKLYRAGEYSKCRELLRDAPNPHAALWLSRMDTRQGREAEAIAKLTGLECNDERTAAERDVMLANATRSVSDYATAHRLLDRALLALKPPDEMYYRAVYVRALAHLVTSEFDAVEPIVETMLDSPDGVDRAQAKALRGWVAAKRGDLRTHLTWMLEALDEILDMKELDQYSLGNTVLSLGVICREVAVPDEVVQRVAAALERVCRVDITAYPLFQSLRTFGWVGILRNDEVSVNRYWRRAQEAAPSEFWRVFCLTDKAYFAQTMGRDGAAREILEQADALASKLTWSEPRDEERLILLTIAQLFSAQNPARSESYLARFRSLPHVMEPLNAWHGDRRSRAMQLYPHAIALLNLGEPETAIGMLEEAWSIYTEFEYGWRAALAALDLFKATSARVWLERARDQIAPWPHSWIARDVRNAR